MLLFHCCTQAELSERQRKVIVNTVSKGKGLVALHCAFWSFQDWPEWRHIVGGIVQGHDPFGPFDAVVVDRNHPITRGLPERFAITDEPYLAGEQGKTNAVTLTISKGQLASLLGTIPETLSRIFFVLYHSRGS